MDPLAAINQPAPVFALPGLEGGIYRLVDQRGKLVILNFWSAECPWAERFDKSLHVFMREWGRNVIIWAIASNENEPPDLVKRVADERGLPVVLLDKKNRVADLYGAQATPYLYLIDAGGILRYQGAPDDVTFRNRMLSRNYLHEAVEAVKAGRLPEPAQTPGYGCAIVRSLD